MHALLDFRYHRERFFALLLPMQHYEQGADEDRTAVFDLYPGNTHCINNWDLANVGATHIVFRHLQERLRKILYKLSRSSSRWERRIAILSTLHFIE